MSFIVIRVVTVMLIIKVKPYRYIFIRSADVMSVSNLTEKCVKIVKNYTIYGHFLRCECLLGFDYFDNLTSDTNKIRFFSKNSLFIKSF